MKRLALLLPVILILISCDKNERDWNYVDYIFAGQENGSGIRYIDVNPDDTIRVIDYPEHLSTTKSLDLNNDKTPDFEFVLDISPPSNLGASASMLRIIPLGSNSVCVSMINGFWVDSLPFGDTINENIKWSDSTALIYSHIHVVSGQESTSGYFFEDYGNYVAVRVEKGGHSFFGWIAIKRTILKRFAVTVPW